MVLELLSDHILAMQTHAESAYPEECCGLLLGQMDINDKILMEVWLTKNTWQTQLTEYWPAETLSSAERRYAIAPLEMLKAQKTARDRNWEIIGIYHSHPNNPAIPSQFDLECAWAQYSYIIISVQQGKTADIRSWSLDDRHQFQPEEILICS